MANGRAPWQVLFNATFQKSGRPLSGLLEVSVSRVFKLGLWALISAKDRFSGFLNDHREASRAVSNSTADFGRVAPALSVFVCGR